MASWTRSIVGAASALLFGLGNAASAQVSLLPVEVERVDVIAIERDGRDVFAFDAVGGGRAVERLELDEAIVFQATRGRLGLLITDRRVLAVASGGGFQYHSGCTCVNDYGDPVVVIETSHE